jgi:hypothetical protein
MNNPNPAFEQTAWNTIAGRPGYRAVSIAVELGQEFPIDRKPALVYHKVATKQKIEIKVSPIQAITRVMRIDLQASLHAFRIAPDSCRHYFRLACAVKLFGVSDGDRLKGPPRDPFRTDGSIERDLEG